MNITALLLIIAFLVGILAAVLTGFLTWISAQNVATALLAGGAAFTGGVIAVVTVMSAIGAFSKRT